MRASGTFVHAVIARVICVTVAAPSFSGFPLCWMLTTTGVPVSLWSHRVGEAGERGTKKGVVDAGAGVVPSVFAPEPVGAEGAGDAASRTSSQERRSISGGIATNAT